MSLAPRFPMAVSFCLGLLCLCGCSDDAVSPSAPSPSTPVTTTMGEGNTGDTAVSISGTVRDAVTGAAIEGALVSVSAGDVVPVRTGPDGTFTITQVPTVAPALPMAIEAEGYHRRDTDVDPTSADVDVDILPDGGGFDLDFYDHVFRDLGDGDTHRWAQEPEIVVWTNAFECATPTQGEGCRQLMAIDDPIPDSFEAVVRDIIHSDAPKYTGGEIRGTNAIRESVPAGTVVGIENFLQRGRITIAFLARGDNFSWAFWNWFRQSRSMYAGHIQINRRHRSFRGVFSHELAHLLGFSHPRGSSEVPLRSIMRTADVPTNNDILHGRILYRRPSGSRTPDVDPDFFTINAVRRPSDEGPLVFRDAR